MPSGATIPAENDVLCENCGYVLNGLPPGSNCPECGRPAAESDPALRAPTAWEASRRNGTGAGGAFLTTSATALFRPTHFYRTLATRTDTRQSATFAQVYWAAAAMLLGLAASAHAEWFVFGDPRSRLDPLKWAALSAAAYFFLRVTNALAARLTHWEASYRSIRLTLPVVRRGLRYHAVHYVPVAAAAAFTVLGYAFLIRSGVVDAVATTTTYLYVLSAEVVIAAIYLFKTYWIAMRRMMYANA